jgi:hypothetical protein
MFGGLGILNPYIPIFFERLHMSKPQIGILLMIPSLTSFIFAPAWSALSDKFDIRTELILFTLVISQFLTMYMYWIEAFYSMMVVVLISSIIKSPLSSLLDSLVMETLTDKTLYGSIRLWGAVSFALTSLGGGIILSSFDKFETTSVRPFFYVFGLNAVFAILTGMVTVSITIVLWRMKAENIKIETVSDIEELDIKIAQNEDNDLKVQNEDNNLNDIEDCNAIQLPEIEDVIEDKNSQLCGFLCADFSVGIFFIVVFLSGLVSGVINGFLFLRLKQLGGSGMVMGVARFITCAAEVPCFQIAGFLQKRLGNYAFLLGSHLLLYSSFV